MAGAREVNSDVTFLVNFLDSWYDPPKAKESAFAMIDAGADVMYAERFGVADAAVERGKKAIGNVIDTASDYPGTILASALWHMEATIDTAVSAVADGSYTADDYSQYSYMAHNGGSLTIDKTLVPANIVAAIAAKEAAIRNGSFVVTINDETPVSDN
jgi:basic membrane lipoprotein Med (substrate-binding protein (PBP1-ABC) superfamily)